VTDERKDLKLALVRRLEGNRPEASCRLQRSSEAEAKELVD
jgi:hypothetical protein